MAATDNPISPRLAALATAAMALPGLVPQARAAMPIENMGFDIDYSYYEEGGANRMKVEVEQATFRTPLLNQFDFTINGVRDAISGASPIFNTPCQNTPSGGPSKNIKGGSSVPSGRNCTGALGKTRQIMSAETISDIRDGVDMKLNYYHGDTTVGLGGGVSKEHDYNSDFVNFDLRQELNNKLTTVAFGYGYSSDVVSPTHQDWSKDKRSHQFLAGLTQVLGKNTLWQGNLTYSFSDGYLTDPYKYVWSLKNLNYPNYNIPHEKRPSEHHQWAVLNRVIQYFPDLNGAALHGDYRYFVDDWGVHAHTLELGWIQPIAGGWKIEPKIRYYSQDQASFYHDFFWDISNAKAYSSDYRLADFGAISAGVKIRKELFHNRLDLHAGFDYYKREANMAIGGGDKHGDFADYEFFVYTAGVNIKF